MAVSWCVFPFLVALPLFPFHLSRNFSCPEPPNATHLARQRDKGVVETLWVGVAKKKIVLGENRAQTMLDRKAVQNIRQRAASCLMRLDVNKGCLRLHAAQVALCVWHALELEERQAQSKGEE